MIPFGKEKEDSECERFWDGLYYLHVVDIISHFGGLIFLVHSHHPILLLCWSTFFDRYIDDIINPRETRKLIIQDLALLQGKTAKNPPKKHGNIPL